MPPQSASLVQLLPGLAGRHVSAQYEVLPQSSSLSQGSPSAIGRSTQEPSRHLTRPLPPPTHSSVKLQASPIGTAPRMPSTQSGKPAIVSASFQPQPR